MAIDGTALGATPENWAVHGQLTFIDQYHPSFRSTFRGSNSMDPAARGSETVTASIYAGLRPWEGGEAWADFELDQGFGLSNTTGAAAFPNGEGSKVGQAIPYYRLQRLFFRQTFDIGGDQEDVAPDQMQLGAGRTKDNLVVTAGKFSVTDIFDTNTYAHDPSGDFLNWAVMDAGAFDYAADAWGYSYGIATEWNVGDWSMRAGLFDLSRIPNGTELVRDFSSYQADAEVERRFQLFGQAGKVKLLSWVSHGNMGSYNDATMLANITAQPANIALVRKTQDRPGLSFNMEQSLSDDLGFFLRSAINDGSKEAYEFTDMDNTISLGLALKGALWERADDKVGLAFESGGLSVSGQRFLNAGGLGILIGDGRLLHYDRENLVEAYYNWAAFKALAVSLDYQLLVNPAYNADRGPISIFGARLHAEF